MKTAAEKRFRRRVLIWQVALLVGGLAAWEVGMSSGLLALVVDNPGFWFSSPGQILGLLQRLARSGQLYQHIWLTISAALMGLGIGALAGTAAGLAMAATPRLAKILEPFWTALNALPKIALAPALVTAFGLGIASKVALAVTLVFFVFLYNTIGGLRGIDRTLINHFRLMGAGRLQMLQHVIVPTLVAWLYGALKVGLGLSIMGVVAAEFVAARGGIGFVIQYGFGTFNVTWCYVGILVLMILSLGLSALIDLGERQLIRAGMRRS